MVFTVDVATYLYVLENENVQYFHAHCTVPAAGLGESGDDRLEHDLVVLLLFVLPPSTRVDSTVPFTSASTPRSASYSTITIPSANSQKAS